MLRALFFRSWHFAASYFGPQLAGAPGPVPVLRPAGRQLVRQVGGHALRPGRQLVHQAGGRAIAAAGRQLVREA